MRDLFDELPDVTPEISPAEWFAIEKAGGLDNYYLECLARGSLQTKLLTLSSDPAWKGDITCRCLEIKEI